MAIALRHSLIELAAARQAGEGQQEADGAGISILDWTTFPAAHRSHRREILGNALSDLDKERKAMTRLWAKREGQIRGVVEATAGMYGDLQGIAGKALEEIDGIGLPMIEDKGQDDNSIAA